MVPSLNDNRNILEELRRETSLDLLGVADIQQERSSFQGFPTGFLQAFPLAIVIAVHVSSAVLNTLEDGPNLVYYHHYRQLNSQLDQAAIRIAQEIERKGYSALPVPASQIIDWQKMVGQVSHKQIANLAGLGWRGRNNLLVSPEWGAQVRLASILTDFPLQPANPLNMDCGSCRRCLAVCPASAITMRATDFNHKACYTQLSEFSKIRHIGQHICGLCVKVCPGATSGRASLNR